MDRPTTSRIPLFPLGVVLLPGVQLPLHIFEERYREMTRYCMETGSPFGVVYYSGSTLKRSGTCAEISQVTKKYDDGRMDILTTGSKRFFITELYQDRSYMEADVEYFDDKPNEHPGAVDNCADEARSMLQKLSRLLDKGQDYSALGNLDPQALSFMLASTEFFNLEERQEALEISSVKARLDQFIIAAQRVIHRVEATVEIKKLLGDEGDVTHLFN